MPTLCHCVPRRAVGRLVPVPLLVPWDLCHLCVSWVFWVTVGAIASVQLAFLQGTSS